MDYSFADRQALIHNTPAFRRQQKVRAAIETLGERHVLHHTNRVKRAPHRAPDLAHTDVAKTFRRVIRAGGDLV